MISTGYKNFSNNNISFCAKNRTIQPTNTNLQLALGKENVLLLDEIRKIAEKSGTDTYLVGGAVRDTLINQAASDLDVMVNGDALEFAKTLKKEKPDLFKGFFLKKSVGRSVVFTDRMKLDIVPLCPDGSLVGDKDSVRKALERNIRHRDYTVNSMFIHLGSDKDGKIKLKLIDKIRGKKDLHENVLRCVSEDNFRGDHVNSLRGIRLVKKLGMKHDAKSYRTVKKCFEHDCKKNFVYILRSLIEYAKIFSLSKNPLDMYKTLKKYNVFKSF